MKRKITILGGGNLGQAIALGLLESGFSAAGDITITRRNVEWLSTLAGKGLSCLSNNVLAVRHADIVILAVKPFQVAGVLQEIQEALKPGAILVSVVTGVLLSELAALVVPDMAIVRAMPNTAVAIRESMTCICYHKVQELDKDYVQQLFQSLGKTVEIDEALMEAATVLGACGTAYAMRYIRANIQGGIEIGFDAVTASFIAAQTVKGAAELLLRNGTHPEYEIDKVTTPKGCTIAGLNEMEHGGFSSSLIKGVVASHKKIARG